MKINIEWEHGDADLNITEQYEIDDIDLFLNFIYELTNDFNDDHYTKIDEHNFPIYKRYPEYEDMIPRDVFYDQYRPSVNKIYIENDKNIVLTHHLLNNKIVLPKIGETIYTNTYSVCGGSIGLFPNYKFPYYRTSGEPLLKMDIEATVIEIKLKNKYEYKSNGLRYFTYEILSLTTDGKEIITRVDGYDETFDHSNLNVYYFKKSIDNKI